MKPLDVAGPALPQGADSSAPSPRDHPAPWPASQTTWQARRPSAAAGSVDELHISSSASLPAMPPLGSTPPPAAASPSESRMSDMSSMRAGSLPGTVARGGTHMYPNPASSNPTSSGMMFENPAFLHDGGATPTSVLMLPEGFRESQVLRSSAVALAGEGTAAQGHAGEAITVI